MGREEVKGDTHTHLHTYTHKMHTHAVLRHPVLIIMSTSKIHANRKIS